MKWCRVYKCWYRDIEKIRGASGCNGNCKECGEEVNKDGRMPKESR